MVRRQASTISIGILLLLLGTSTSNRALAWAPSLIWRRIARLLVQVLNITPWEGDGGEEPETPQVGPIYDDEAPFGPSQPFFWAPIIIMVPKDSQLKETEGII